MKTLTLILVVFSLPFFGIDQAFVQINYKYESTIIVKIKKHTGEEIHTAQELLLKNNALVIDYKCLASGIIVLKLSHNFAQESDVKHLIFKSLSSKIPVNRVGIIFVDIHSKTIQC